MYTFLTDSFANHVKSALLNKKFYHLKEHVKFLSLVDLEYHTVTRQFICNAVKAIKQQRYAKMIYAVDAICNILKNIGTVSNIASGQDAMKASVTSAISVAGEHMNLTNLISLTAGFLPNNQNPQTASCSSKTNDQISDEDIAHMAGLNFKMSYEKVRMNHEKLTHLEEARDAIEDTIASINNKNTNSNRSYINNDNSNKKERIRMIYQHTRTKCLHDIEKKLSLRRPHKKKKNQTNTDRYDNQYSSFDVISHDEEIYYDTYEDKDKSDNEISVYDDKISSEAYLLTIFRKHDQKDLELRFLESNTLDADIKFVEQREQKQQHSTLFISAISNVPRIRSVFEQYPVSLQI
ncbi:unnamed protein product [Rotaria sp. Silwood1]|nr:unnamed protein product [Rotaria sp. Silwood1]